MRIRMSAKKYEYLLKYFTVSRVSTIIRKHMSLRTAIKIAIASIIALAPLSASAATSSSFEISGWVPYWRAATGTADVISHISELTEVDPFVYSVQNNGAIFDNAPMDESPWTDMVSAAKANHVRVIPTVMWSNSSAEESILTKSAKRIALEKSIVSLVKANHYDGIDIDFENKPAALKNYFSTFLKGLYQRMGNKWVTCDIEARTPVDSRYYGTSIPPDAEVYANDFTQINKYCDRVRLMTYDQQGVDLRLAAQAASSSQLYAPVADPAWVEKVVNLARKTIRASKLVIGVPTYGYEYDVTAYADNQYNYDIMWTFNPLYALQTAAQYGVTPTRNSAGEMEFTYTPSLNASTTAPVSLGNNSALIAAAAASMYATQYNSHLDFRLVDWPDAQSISDKVDLAKELGVRGVAIFKLDGGEDPNMWSALQGVKR